MAIAFVSIAANGARLPIDGDASSCARQTPPSIGRRAATAASGAAPAAVDNPSQQRQRRRRLIASWATVNRTMLSSRSTSATSNSCFPLRASSARCMAFSAAFSSI